tara:strand:+ start:305 stop:544 length:240 start_codon:yes stop_codon:yes gene_type:complete
MTPKTPTQNSSILYHLENYGSLTQAQALPLFACSRLAARINDLRRAGHNILTRHKKLNNGKRVAEYYIPKIQNQGELPL